MRHFTLIATLFLITVFHSVARAQTAPAPSPEIRDWRYVLTIHEIAQADDDIRLAQLVIDNPDRVLVRLPDGRTPVHVATEVGALKSLRVLAKAGAALNVTDNKSRTPLTIALGMNYENTTKTLIELGADVNMEGVADNDAAAGPLTPLNHAVRTGNMNMLRLLLTANADLNKPSADGSIPITAAAAAKQHAMVTILINNKANINAKDRQGRTALHYAAEAANVGLVIELLRANADPRLTDNQGRSALSLTQNAVIWKELVAKGANVNLVVGGVTPLQYFINQGNLDLVKTWLDYKPDPFLTDRQGRTAKELARKAAGDASTGDRVEIARILEVYQARYALEQEAREEQADKLAAALTNTEIQWSGNIIGLMPNIEGQNAKALLTLGTDAVPALMNALDDSNKFAAAHVLLTQILVKSLTASAEKYNGLRVGISGQPGGTTIPPDQIPDIKYQWQKFQSEQH